MGLFDQSPWEQLTGQKSPIEKKMSPLQKEYARGTIGIVGMVSPVSAWNAIGTTGKVLVGTGAGLLGGSLFFGSKKQEQTQNFAPQNPSNTTNTKTITTTNTFTNSTVGDWSTNMIYNSPGAMLKKGSMSGSAVPAVNVIPSVSVIPTATAAQKGDQGQGTDWATLAAIAGVALVAYGYTSRKGAK